MKQTSTKKLDEAHHRWLRKILHVSCKGKISNEKISQRTQQEELKTSSEKGE